MVREWFSKIKSIGLALIAVGLGCAPGNLSGGLTATEIVIPVRRNVSNLESGIGRPALPNRLTSSMPTRQRAFHLPACVGKLSTQPMHTSASAIPSSTGSKCARWMWIPMVSSTSTASSTAQ